MKFVLCRHLKKYITQLILRTERDAKRLSNLPDFFHSCIRTHYMLYFAKFNGMFDFKEAFKLAIQSVLYVVVFALFLGR